MHLKFHTLSLNDSGPLLAESSVKPSQQQICDDILLLWREEPITDGLSVDLLYDKVMGRHPEWILDRTEFKNAVRNQHLDSNDERSLKVYNDFIDIPSFNDDYDAIIDKKTSSNVCVKNCKDGHKGRGLYALKDFVKDDLIFKESYPIVVVPSMERLTLMKMGKACSLCGGLLSHLSKHFIVVHSLDCDNCGGVWCSNECKNIDIGHNTLKHLHKSKINGIDSVAWGKFEKYCNDNVFVAAYSIGVIMALALIDKKNTDKIRKKFNLLSSVSQGIRINESDSTNIGGTFDASSGAMSNKDPEPIWKTSYELLKNAIPTTDELDMETYLSYIGRYNINQISDQMFFLPSLINHNCEPNVRFEVVSNKEIRVYARKNISAGQELLTNYINPLHGVKLRRRELRVNYGFLCHCDRCIKEIKRNNDVENENLSNSINNNGGLSVPNDSLLTRRKSSMRTARPDLSELLKTGQEFDLDIPENLSGKKNRRTSVRFVNQVTLAVEE
ncbi:hypothetical protein Kpol_1000p13 [Vanderwaltozyma polyspora DSM 70294]|uniref:Histone-lysine N-methyltransferase SET5 n=1 Tax=Vanderwaltozyma polyspora (strain ATCC 22028 / DSM 70294 / BCRC 21397 / CBS 2163 / NBRC 10782 / NRRL Y-8283 / UCD 57-17) TaxID=436907 RepID=SET5_VANPO|nr:uncharacterized protein Kpol_1000p13 [Vanderwaltozyma polyspora DSM 70294]A7TPV3.1 RecName: Full=Potential protein lysine methyltransferase SET5; AltName: Full=SET domain-containing protein 5 [Vanderwaltozyma polyspora DSM 70294]EDO15701.1 hypothetical protein Kpol_1000p13 [Vanderwaltozyma polyspora DSM 70294]